MKGVPEIFLEMDALGEAPADRHDQIEADPELRRRVEFLGEANEAFLEDHPADDMVPRIRERLLRDSLTAERTCTLWDDQRFTGLSRGAGTSTGQEPQGPREPHEPVGRPGASAVDRGGPFRRAQAPRLVLGFAGAAAAAIVVLVAALLAGGEARLDDGVRTKGLEPRLNVYRLVGYDGDGNAQVATVDSGEQVPHFTDLQVSYIAAGKPYGAIFSVDGRGTITLHHPIHADATPRLQPFGEIYLPDGFRLDDAPDFERFYFVTSPDPFDVRELLVLVEAQYRSPRRLDDGEISLPEPFDVHVVHVEKPRRD